METARTVVMWAPCDKTGEVFTVPEKKSPSLWPLSQISIWKGMGSFAEAEMGTAPDRVEPERGLAMVTGTSCWAEAVVVAARRAARSKRIMGKDSTARPWMHQGKRRAKIADAWSLDRKDEGAEVASLRVLYSSAI